MNIERKMLEENSENELHNKFEENASTKNVNLKAMKFKSDTSSAHGSNKFDQEATLLLK